MMKPSKPIRCPEAVEHIKLASKALGEHAILVRLTGPDHPKVQGLVDRWFNHCEQAMELMLAQEGKKAKP